MLGAIRLENVIQQRLGRVNEPSASPPKRIKLPPQVARIYEAVAELEAEYPGRPFTPDGHMVGSIGEVVAAEALGLTLLKVGHPGHDAHDGTQHVQIKMTGGRSVALYANCERLVVLRVVSPHEAEIAYDGPGQPAWDAAGKAGKTSQRVISLSALRRIASKASIPDPTPWELHAREGRFEAIPTPFVWDASAMFAHLLNGYDILGMDALARLANQKCEAAEAGEGWDGSATDLWLCLFFEHRRWRHAGMEPEGRYLHALDNLCETLRQRLMALGEAERKSLLALLAAHAFPGTVESLTSR